MADKDTTDNERQAKLLAARKKLKKFQNKKMDGDFDQSSPRPSSDHDSVLFTNHGTPLAKSTHVDPPAFIPPPSSELPPLDQPTSHQDTPNQQQQQILLLEQENAALRSRLEQYDKTQASEQQHQQAARQTLLDDHQAEIQTLHNDHKQEIQTLHDDYNTEMTRLIDLVSDLEESLAETQAATYTKECERSALEKALHDLTTTGSTQGLKDTLVLVTQERDGLRDQLQAKQDDTKDSTAANLHQQQQHDTAMAELQQQHDTAMAELQQQHDKAIAELRQQHDSAMADLQQQLDSAVSSSETKEQGLGVLTDSVQRLEQHRANLQSKLDEKDDTLQRLEHTLIAKDKELETARLQKNETIQARMDELQAKVERVTTMYAHIEQKATQAVDEQQQRADLVLAETRHAWRTQVSHLTRQLHQEHGDWIHVRTKSPSLGLLPPLVKPAFTTFLETPRCSGCQSGAIDI